MKCSGHVKEMRNAYKIFVRRLKGICHVGDLGINGRMRLKCILDK
jgi:hypothetical protein